MPKHSPPPAPGQPALPPFPEVVALVLLRLDEALAASYLPFDSSTVPAARLVTELETARRYLMAAAQHLVLAAGGPSRD